MSEEIRYRSDYSRVSYTPSEMVREVKATMALSGFELSTEGIEQMKAIQDGKITGDEYRHEVIQSYQVDDGAGKMYRSIIQGLQESIDDVKGEERLQRNIVEEES